MGRAVKMSCCRQAEPNRCALVKARHIGVVTSLLGTSVEPGSPTPISLSRVPGSTVSPLVQQAETVRFGQLWRYITNVLPARHAKADAEIDALSKSLGKTSITPEDHVMASRSLRNADHEEDSDSTHIDVNPKLSSWPLGSAPSSKSGQGYPSKRVRR